MRHLCVKFTYTLYNDAIIMSILRRGGFVKDSLARYTFRVSPHLLDKLHYIAEADGRSVNKELEWLVRCYIEEFEEKHGEIKLINRSSAN